MLGDFNAKREKLRSCSVLGEPHGRGYNFRTYPVKTESDFMTTEKIIIDATNKFRTIELYISQKDGERCGTSIVALE